MLRAMSTIADVAARLEIPTDCLMQFGDFAAKIDPKLLLQKRRRPGKAKLVLVTAITPTRAGEGKTTTTIGLGDAFNKLGESVVCALREPSLGPCLGVKGGGTGGGRAQLTPSERINLHFTGDFHAISSAHSAVAAIVDNSVHFGSDASIDPRRVLWPRVVDMNDRALRNVMVGLGKRSDGMPRQSSFVITAASEIMAMLCLASDVEDLRKRLARTVVAYNHDRDVVTVDQLKATGVVLALLRDAVMPNLARTMEGTPALVHGGPFANIAHGCSSVLATRTGMHLADWVITEAGFGSDLGAEKFFDIKCRTAGLDVSAVVVVASARALKLHGGHDAKALDVPDTAAVARGIANLEKHLENVRGFGLKPVVALNRFATDTDAEVDVVRDHCASLGVPFAVASHFANGGEGAIDLAKAVIAAAEPTTPTFTYELEDGIPEKIRKVARKIYGADDVVFAGRAPADLRTIKRLGYDHLPVCIAKTPASLSDDPKRVGRPRDFNITVRNIQLNAGAGFLVVLTGDVMRMPGLPRVPRSEVIDLRDGEVVNLA